MLQRALLLANAGAAILGYSLPTTPRRHAALQRNEDNNVGAAKMFVEDDATNDGSKCDIIFAQEPIEDPMFACWLNPESDSLHDYICVQEHPCLDIMDGVDHSEDSY